VHKITFLPKNPVAEEVQDFILISLIHGIAKLVAKVIAKQVALIPHQLVGVHQSTFVHGRRIHTTL
jgi:hypothetical protein